MGHTVDVLNC